MHYYVTGGIGQFNITQITQRCLTLKGFRVGSTEHMEQMVAAVEQSNLKPAIDSIYDIDNIQDAFSRLSSGGKFGKICVRVAR